MKKVALVVLAVILTGSLLVLIVSLATLFTLLSPEKIKDELAESDLYASVLIDGPDELLPRIDSDEEFSGHSLEAVGTVIREQLDEDDVRIVAESVVDQIFDILSGRETKYVLKIDLKETKDKIREGFPDDDPIHNEFGKVPDVFELDLAEIAEDENPPRVNFTLPTRIAVWSSGVVSAIVVILMAVLAGPGVKRRFRWLGIALLIPGVLGLVYAVAAAFVIGGIDFFSFGDLGTLLPDALARAMGEFISSLILANLAFVRWESLGLVVVSLLLIAFSLGGKKRQTDLDATLVEER